MALRQVGRLAAACAVLGLLGGGAGYARQVATIVLPRDATTVERSAAEELRRCLGLATAVEARLSLVPAGSGLTFYVGTVEEPSRLTAYPASRLRARTPALVEDGVYLGSDGRNVVLLGKGPRGALNAVYCFLEDRLGFHWPEPSQEYVPSSPPQQLGSFELVHNPAFAYRGIAIHGRCGAQWFAAIVDWLAKNRMNGFQVFPDHYEQLRSAAVVSPTAGSSVPTTVLAEILKRGLYPNIGGHSREFYFPAHKYFPTHPEWFALVQGKRSRDTQLCYSDLTSVPEYAANVVSYLRTRPEIGMASLWPSDGYGFCECEKCKAGHVTDTLLNYVNAVTAEVTKLCPGIETEFLSYIHYVVPPKDVRPLPQVVPTYCEYWSRSQFHPITDDRSGNATCRKQMEAWIAASRQVTLFSYYGDDCIKRFIYNPLIDMIRTDVQYYRSIGLAGNFVLLTNPESWWSHAPHLYAYTRFAWNPDLPLAAVQQDYYGSLYGKAAPAMLAHAQASRALFGLKLAQGGSGEDLLWGRSLGCNDPVKIEQTRRQGKEAVAGLRDCLGQAEAAAPGEYVRQRLAKLRADADYLAWLFDFSAAAELAAAHKTPQAKQALVDLAAQGLQLEVVAEDDRQGYRSARNVLLDTTRRLAGREPPASHGTKAQLAEYERDGIWRWATTDIVPSAKDRPRRIEIDVTKRVTGAGDWEVVWQYLEGADGLFILSTGLYSTTVAEPKPEDLKLLAVDEHPGFTGGGNSRNVYTLKLDRYEPGLKYFVVAQVYDEREFDTFGHVLLRKR